MLVLTRSFLPVWPDAFVAHLAGAHEFQPFGRNWVVIVEC